MKGKLLKSMGVLTGATLFSQVLNFILLPIYTRLYSPEDFELFAIFVSVISILIVISSFRFEIFVPRASESEAKLLLVLSISISMFFCFFVYILGMLLESYISKDIYEVWFLICFVGVAYSISNSMYMYFVSKDWFGKIAFSRIFQSLVSNGTQLSLAYTSIKSLGLVFGYLSMHACSSLYMIYNSKINLRDIKFCDLKKTFYLYKRRAKLSLLEGIMDVASYQLPILIIGLKDDKAGFVFIAMKIINIPVAMFSQSFSSVTYSKLCKIQDVYDVKRNAIRFAKLSFLISLFIIFSLGTASYFLIDIFLGHEWALVKDIIIKMLPGVLLYLFFSSNSKLFYVFSLEGFLSILNTVGFIVRVMPILIISYVNISYSLVDVFIFTFTMHYLILSLSIVNILRR